MKKAEVINIKETKKNKEIVCMCPFCEEDNTFIWKKDINVNEEICWECDMQFLVSI